MVGTQQVARWWLPAALAMTLLACASGPAVKGEATTIAPPGLGFEVRFPPGPRPVHSVTPVDTDTGPVEAHMWVVEVPDVYAFVASSTEVPDPEGGARQLLERTRDAVMDAVLGQVQREEWFTVDGRTGLRLWWTYAPHGEDLYGRSAMVFDGGRLIQLQFLGVTEESVSEEPVERFFSSLRLTGVTASSGSWERSPVVTVAD